MKGVAMQYLTRYMRIWGPKRRTRWKWKGANLESSGGGCVDLVESEGGGGVGLDGENLELQACGAQREQALTCGVPLFPFAAESRAFFNTDIGILGIRFETL